MPNRKGRGFQLACPACGNVSNKFPVKLTWVQAKRKGVQRVRECRRCHARFRTAETLLPRPIVSETKDRGLTNEQRQERDRPTLKHQAYGYDGRTVGPMDDLSETTPDDPLEALARSVRKNLKLP